MPQSAAAPQAAGETEEIQKGPSVTKSGDGGFRLEISLTPPTNAELAEDPDALGTTKMKWVPTGGANHITENNTLGTGIVYVLEYRTDPTDPDAWETVPNAASWYANEAGLAAGTTVAAGERGATIAVFETLDHDTYELRVRATTTEVVQIGTRSITENINYSGGVTMDIVIDGTAAGGNADAVRTMFDRATHNAAGTLLTSGNEATQSASVFYVQYKDKNWEDGDDYLEARINFNVNHGVALPGTPNLGEAYARWGFFNDGDAIGRLQLYLFRDLVIESGCKPSSR